MKCVTQLIQGWYSKEIVVVVFEWCVSVSDTSSRDRGRGILRWIQSCDDVLKLVVR